MDLACSLPTRACRHPHSPPTWVKDELVGSHNTCSSSSSATSFSNTCCSPIFTMRVAPTAVLAPPDCALGHSVKAGAPSWLSDRDYP